MLNPHKYLKSAPQSNSFVFTVLFALILIGYSFSIGADFHVFDDNMAIVENEHIKDVKNIPKILTSSFFEKGKYYRPLVSLSYMLEYHLFGLNPFFYHLTNIILHAVNAFLVFLFAELFFKDRKAMLLTAFLFAIHPIHWEAVSNIAGRSILLCAMFYLGGLIFCGQKSKYRTALCFALALLSKETAITFIIFLPMLEHYLQNRYSGRYAMTAGVIFIAYVVGRSMMGITNIEQWPDFHHLVLGVMTFARSVFTYLRIMFLPVDLHFDRARLFFEHMVNWEVLATILVYIILFCLFLKFRKQIKKQDKFCIYWMFIILLPVFQLVPIVTTIKHAATSDHLFYLPSVGVIILIVRFYTYLLYKRKIKIVKAVFIGWTAFLFATTIQQNIYASREYTLLKQALRYNPENVRLRHSLAVVLGKSGHYKESEIEYIKVIHQEPWNVQARIGLGLTLCNQGKYLECIYVYERVGYAEEHQELLNKNLSLAYKNLADIYLKEGKTETAQEYYEKADAINSDNN